MKKGIPLLFVTFAAAAILCSSCMNEEKPKSETDILQPKSNQLEWIVPKIENLVEWQSFVIESEQMIEINESSINAVKEKIEETGPKAVVLFSEKVGILEQKNLDLKKRLKEYSIESQSDWDVFKMSFKQEIDSVGAELQGVITEQW